MGQRDNGSALLRPAAGAAAPGVAALTGGVAVGVHPDFFGLPAPEYPARVLVSQAVPA
jgi:hypothetical protein